MKFLFSIITIIFVFCNALFAEDDGDSIIVQKYASRMVRHQSAACYGDYVVTVSDTVAVFSLYDMKAKKTLCIYRNAPIRDRQANGSVVFHANNSSFGSKRYSKKDFFPLLYVSNRENRDKRGVLLVYRIIPHREIGSMVFDSMTVSLVQTIYYPIMTDENAMGSPWTVIDQKGKYMYTYSRNNRKDATNKGLCRISKFRVPSLRHEEIVLGDNDIIDSFEILEYKINLSQGACYKNEKLYIAQGVPSKGNLYLRIVDLKKKRLEKTIDLKEIGLKQEPEGCFFCNSKLFISTINGNLYEFKFCF